MDDHTVKIEGPFGGFQLDGGFYTVNAMYFIRPSAHLYTSGGMPMELNIKGYGPKGSVTLVVFFELLDMPEYDVFAYTASFGTGETLEMKPGAVRSNYDSIDMNLAFPTPPEGETLLHYPGTSLFDNCENTLYVINKVTIIINPEQLNELLEKPSNYQVNDMKIIVNDNKKPPEPPKPEEKKPDISDPITWVPYPVYPDILVFYPPIYTTYYGPYPQPRENQPPQTPEKYPAPEFPYPDAWPWTGEPNYPNDPYYPLYVFPPIQPKPAPRPVPVIPLVNYDTFYNKPIYPDQSPQWPYGYPIWPEPSYPVWPQNSDFYPKNSDQCINTFVGWQVAYVGVVPVPPYPFEQHYMYTYPLYSYMNPITYYPHFPVERWPEDPFDPRLYPGYPYSPNEQVVPFN